MKSKRIQILFLNRYHLADQTERKNTNEQRKGVRKTGGRRVLKDLLQKETDWCAFFYSETKQTQNWQHKQCTADTWSFLVEACMFKHLHSNLRASPASVYISKQKAQAQNCFFVTPGSCNTSEKELQGFCWLFLLVKHSLSGLVQQPGRACSMPSRTFLADTSCLQAAFICTHRHTVHWDSVKHG